MSKNYKIIFPIFLWLSITVSAQEQSIDTSQLKELQTFSAETGADGILVLHKNKIIHEWYNPNCDSIYMNTASAVKSWTSIVIGRLIQERKIKNVNELVCDYIPEWKAGCEANVTIKHLLTMTAGIKKRRTRTGPKRFVFLEQNFNEFVLNIELDTLPGSIWSYSNEGVQLLAPIIEKVTGMDAKLAFQQLLFDPLGMDSTSLFSDPSGNGVLFGGAKTTLRDFSKIGQLMFNNGNQDGKQLLPESWVRRATKSIAQNKNYGYLWWVDEENQHYTAMGDFGQLCVVYPNENLIYLRYQTCRNNDPKENLNWMGLDFFKLVKSVVQTD
jgi:CubicO group peptidase (beta-lactamase class C family)